MNENKAEVRKHHPSAYAEHRQSQIVTGWIIWTDGSPRADILGMGATEEAAWMRAALNAGRMR